MNIFKTEGNIMLAVAIVLVVAVVLGIIGFLTWVTVSVVGGGFDIISGTNAVISTAATAALL